MTDSQPDGVKNEPEQLTEEQDTPESPMSIRSIVFTGLGFVVFITVMALAINAIGIEQLQAMIADAGIFGPLIYIAIKAATYVVAPLTSGPIQVFAGTLFDSLWLGVLYTLIGEVIGGSVSFFIARRFGRPAVARFVGKDGMKQVDDFYQNRMGGWRSLAIARVLLFSVWDFLSYACGLAPIRYRTYFLVSVILGFFPTLFFVSLGDRLTNDPTLLPIIYGIVGVMIVIPIIFRKQIEKLMGNAQPKTDNDTAE